MSFRFRLQAILRLREGLEKQEELRLQQINQRIQALREQVASLENLLLRQQSQLIEEIGAGSTAAELHFRQYCHEVIVEQIQQGQESIRGLEQTRQQQTLAYQKARQGREAIECLRDQQHKAYAVKESRESQRQIDDLFLQRKAILRRG